MFLRVSGAAPGVEPVKICSLGRGENIPCGPQLTISGVVVQPLRIQDIVHRHDIVVLSRRSTSHPSQLLHMRPNAQQKPQMHTQRSDICSRFTTDPKHPQIPLGIILDQPTLVDRPHTQLALDSRNQWWSLEQSPCQSLQTAFQRFDAIWEGVVESDDADVFFSGALLGFDKSGGAVDANDQAAGDFGVERAGVTCFFDSEDSFEPGYDFV